MQTKTKIGIGIIVVVVIGAFFTANTSLLTGRIKAPSVSDVKRGVASYAQSSECDVPASVSFWDNGMPADKTFKKGESKIVAQFRWDLSENVGKAQTHTAHFKKVDDDLNYVLPNRYFRSFKLWKKTDQGYQLIANAGPLNQDGRISWAGNYAGGTVGSGPPSTCGSKTERSIIYAIEATIDGSAVNEGFPIDASFHFEIENNDKTVKYISGFNPPWPMKGPTFSTVATPNRSGALFIAADNSLITSQVVDQGAQNVELARIRFSTSRDPVAISGLRMILSGDAGVLSSVNAVNGSVIAGVGGISYQNINNSTVPVVDFDFSARPITIYPNSPISLKFYGNISSSATRGVTVGLNLSNQSAIGVNVGATFENGISFPIRGSTIAIMAQQQ